MLSDGDIRWRMSEECFGLDRLVVEPMPYDQAFQPASLDIKLGDVDKAPQGCDCGFCEQLRWVIEPGEFVLGSTLDFVRMPQDLAARVEGKSSLGRLGLAVHITAGFIDPGFQGQITLELKNLGNDPISLIYGKYIAQLSFYQLSSMATRPYGSSGLNSHYQNQKGVTDSWLRGA